MPQIVQMTSLSVCESSDSYFLQLLSNVHTPTCNLLRYCYRNLCIGEVGRRGYGIRK